MIAVELRVTFRDGVSQESKAQSRVTIIGMARASVCMTIKGDTPLALGRITNLTMYKCPTLHLLALNGGSAEKQFRDYSENPVL